MSTTEPAPEHPIPSSAAAPPAMPPKRTYTARVVTVVSATALALGLLVGGGAGWAITSAVAASSGPGAFRDGPSGANGSRPEMGTPPGGSNGSQGRGQSESESESGSGDDANS